MTAPFDPTSNSPQKWPKKWLLAIYLVLLLGLGLRLYKLDEKSLWGDEFATIASAQGRSIDPVAFADRNLSFDPPAPVPAHVYRDKALIPVSSAPFDCGPTAAVLKQNVHPPLYFCIMHAFIHRWDTSPTVLRLPSILFGILCLRALFGIALLSCSPIETLLATILMTFSAYQIDHSQDARPYTLLILLALFSAWWVQAYIPLSKASPWQSVIAKRLKGSNLCWLGLLLAAGLYTQYFFIPFIGFVVSYAAWQHRNDKRFLLGLAGSLLLAALLFLPWLPTFQAQMHFYAHENHFTRGLWNPIKLPETILRDCITFAAPDNAFATGVILVILFWPFLHWLITSRKPPQSQFLIFALWWVIAVFAGQIGIDLIKHTHTIMIRRYTLLAAPGFYLLLSYLVWHFPVPQKFSAYTLRIRQSVTGLLLIAVATSTVSYFRHHHSSDEFKQAAAFIANNRQANDVVLVNKTGAVAVGMAYYLPPDTLMLGINANSEADLKPDSPLLATLTPIPAQHPRIWLVFAHNAPSTQQRLTGWLAALGYRQALQNHVPGVETALYSR